MLCYKIDVLAALKQAGYNTTRIRRQNLLSERTLTHIRAGRVVDLNHIDALCTLLKCQPGDILFHKIPDE